MSVLDPNTHNDRIAIVVNLATLTQGGASFSVLYIATNATLDGTNVVTYSSPAEVSAAADASQISAQAETDLLAILSQTRNRPSTVKVAKWNKTGGDTLADALGDAIAEDPDFYFIVCESRTPSELLVLAATASATGNLTALAAAGTRLFMVVQDDDADWLTTGLPAAWTTVAAQERAAHIYHDTDAKPAAPAWLGNRASFDLDAQSVPWNAPVYLVDALATGLNQTQKAFIRSNESNAGLPFGTAYDFYVDPGQNCNGRSINQVITADWLETRVREALADLIATMSDAGEKLAVSADGQNRVIAAVNGVFAQGVAAGHFAAGQTSLVGESITSADRTARRLRFTGGAQTVDGAITLSLTFNFSTDPILTP